ncbi:MAG: Cell shape determining protein, MreB/Mrl family [Parcubacteria group bacterium GW2011_GWC1_45_9]|nr:MAG: Cell shape determining protein, MreB/Mrl family [Parcubacteria group bacterium GW2011_GWA1_Parcubacteria_45_10]KKT89287.1 MAG: Cell shape determining protein, MreB/Mrl family [Parcubacteria group bacterium GW2011_GWB1_45_10]KKU17215.1 MAG: Cell shape determining protein, MreB/Mrl family [Parcubacteria group bacterium GW2011_GWC1_45_9]HCI05498.1 rod shape-determining protein [Patescibacteria group bacterium]
MFDAIFGLFSKDIGIDLGTANTLVYIKGRGIVINEPSVVAINEKTNQILAVGKEAKKMVGRTPGHIVAIRPLRHGVVSDFEVTEKMLKYFFDKVQNEFSAFLPNRPRVVVGVPLGGTEVEKRAVVQAGKNAGARQVFLVEEPMAAAIGVKLPVGEASGNFIIDIGGGTAEIAVISLGGIVISRSVRYAGDKLNEDIINYARDQFKMAIGERTAEDIKISIGSAIDSGQNKEMVIKGRNLVSGLPQEILIKEKHVREAIKDSVESLIQAVEETIEKTPPELVADLMTKGLMMTGGGSLLGGLSEYLSERTGVPVRVADDPLTAVVRGASIVLEDIDRLSGVLIDAFSDRAPV